MSESIVGYLARKAEVCQAQAISEAAGLPLEETYRQLVAMESAGQARVVVDYEPPLYRKAVRGWALVDMAVL